MGVPGTMAWKGKWCFPQDSCARATGAKQAQDCVRTSLGGGGCGSPVPGMQPQSWGLAASFCLGWHRGHTVGHSGSELAGHKVSG